ncbi:sensor histidine kinase [Leucobacter komagatae]|uniref:sensor histidine kinase n=1 Tax=Leucobacter komagatae TaxID=55969 RepID=UPI0014770C40|nr:histidine kinase [Leucobacter komagatae]
MSSAASGERELALPPARSRIAEWFASRPRIGDVAVILACAVPAGVALIIESRELGSLGWACVFGVAVTLWWRRSHPLAVLLIAVGIASLNPVYAHSLAGPSSEMVFGVFALATRARLRTTLIGAALAAVVVLGVSAAAVAIGIREALPAAIIQPFGVAALAAGVAVRTAKGRRAAIEQVIALREERAAAAERARITAEMHDVVAHSVTVMVALAGGAAAGWEKHPERARAALTQLGEVGAGALEEMQQILRMLRDGDPVLDGAIEASGHNVASLGELIEVFQSVGLPVTLAIEGEVPADPGLRTTVYRIVQESLTNALRHARNVTFVEVRVSPTADDVTVRVTDNGRGGAGLGAGPGPGLGSVPCSVPGSGVGLSAMRERARAFGGELSAGPLPAAAGGASAGWQTRVTLPRSGVTR